MRDYERIFKSLVNELVNDTTNELKKEFEAQGHNNTGALLKSFESDIITASSDFVGEISAEYYAEILDSGVKKSKIPFRPGSGAKSSKFIDALINYFKSKGKSEQLAKRIAFATAFSMKRQGMPTKRSFRFSSNGRRLGAFKRVETISEYKVSDKIETFAETSLNDIINEMQIIVNG